MIKITITGKADKRILSYPLMRACSIAGRTCIITDDVAYKRLYAGKENNGEIEGIKIFILPTMSSVSLKEIEEESRNDEIEYLICISDSYCSKDSNHILMLCEQNNTFLGTSIEDIRYDYENVTFGTLTMNPRKYKASVPKELQIHQLAWKPQHALYLYQVEETRQLLPLKDKSVSSLLVNAFSFTFNMKPETLQDLLRRKRFSFTKNDK